MGIGGIGIWQLLIVLLIVVLLFGTKRLRNMGQDVGNAVRSFRSAVKDGEEGSDEYSERDSEETSEQLSEDSQTPDADFEGGKHKDRQKP